MTNRRGFLMGAGGLAAGAAIARQGELTDDAMRFTPTGGGLRITGTFLDEITWDIPHQNWGYRQWEQDFRHMKAIGIDTVILIRCGLDRFIAYPSDYLIGKKGCYRPPIDLVEMFLTLSDRYGIKFYFGTYHDRRSGGQGENFAAQYDDNMFVVDEAWRRYGHHRSFRGWYVTYEMSAKPVHAKHAPLIGSIGRHCKSMSGGLPVLLSPFIDGTKCVSQYSSVLGKKGGDTAEDHERKWDEIFASLKGGVDQCAFQDGHVEFFELDAFLAVNRRLATKYGVECWTNVETFDRDMPIKFLPIKLEKVLLKLQAATRAKYDKAITFEFSHFMSPQSVYLSAGNLYERYCEYFGIDTIETCRPLT